MFTFRDFDSIKHAGVSRFPLKSELLWLPPPIYCILHCCKTCNPWTIPLSSRWSSNLACLYRWLQLPLIAWVLSLGSTSLSDLVHAGILEISSSSKGFQMSSLFTWRSSDGRQYAKPEMPSCHLTVLLSLWLLYAWDAPALTSPLEVLLFWPNCKLFQSVLLLVPSFHYQLSKQRVIFHVNAGLYWNRLCLAN